MNDYIEGYKVFNLDWTCKGFQFEVGKTYKHEEKLIYCRKGFHFCEKVTNCFNYYTFDPENKVAKVKGLATDGNIIKGDDKHCTREITILEEISWEEVLKLCNSGTGNSGYRNSGNYNSGNYNSGNYNSGNYNSGNYNSGDYNSGDNNSGDNNSGHYNSGHYNSGDNNSGHRNSGNNNSGHRNSGHRNSGNNNSGNNNSGNNNSGNNNSGHRNSGYYNSGNNNSGNNNSGHRNSGYYNSGDNNSGWFNTNEPKMRFFNKNSKFTFTEFLSSDYYIMINLPISEWIYHNNMTDEEKKLYPFWETTKGYLKILDYKEAWEIWWKKNPYEHKKVKNLPNFNAKIFKEITGIDITKEEQS